jgi:hypothetical protein
LAAVFLVSNFVSVDLTSYRLVLDLVFLHEVVWVYLIPPQIILCGFGCLGLIIFNKRLHLFKIESVEHEFIPLHLFLIVMANTIIGEVQEASVEELLELTVRIHLNSIARIILTYVHVVATVEVA